MKRLLNTNVIISIGLALMGIIAVSGWIVISIKTGTSSGTEIPLSLSSGLVGILSGKAMADAGVFKKDDDTPRSTPPSPPIQKKEG